MELKDLATKLKQYGENVVTNGNLVKRKCAIAVDSTLVLATPVDTGRARSNWQVGSGTPLEGVLEPYVPGTAGSTGEENAQAAIDQGTSVIQTSTPEVPLNITNNLDYIGMLNDGSSSQAPAGFVAQAVIAAAEAIKASAPILTGSEVGG